MVNMKTKNNHITSPLDFLLLRVSFKNFNSSICPKATPTQKIICKAKYNTYKSDLSFYKVPKLFSRQNSSLKRHLSQYFKKNTY